MSPRQEVRCRRTRTVLYSLAALFCFAGFTAVELNPTVAFTCLCLAAIPGGLAGTLSLRLTHPADTATRIVTHQPASWHRQATLDRIAGPSTADLQVRGRVS